MASTKDLKAKFEKDAAKAGAAPAPDSAAGKKALFEQAIKEASPKDPKPKVRRYGSSWGGHVPSRWRLRLPQKSWAANQGKADPLAGSHTKYKVRSHRFVIRADIAGHDQVRPAPSREEVAL